MPQNQKTSVSAKAVLQDIRAGMSDPDLMEKYRLSVQGLQSLMKKMVVAGIIDPG